MVISSSRPGREKAEGHEKAVQRARPRMSKRSINDRDEGTGLTNATAPTADDPPKRASTSRVTLNVGGTRFETTVDTLRNFSGSFFDMMFGGMHEARADPDGSYFIDRSGEHFGAVLNFMRTGKVKLPTSQADFEAVCEEMQYYQLDEPFTAALHLHADYSRREFLDHRVSGHLNFSGANLTGLNLTGFDLRKCIIKRGVLCQAILTNTLLHGCFLADADLSRAEMDGCTFSDTTNLSYAKLHSVNLSKAKFGPGANCYGADLTNAKLDGAEGVIRIDGHTKGLDGLVCSNMVGDAFFRSESSLRTLGEIPLKALWSDLKGLRKGEFVALTFNDVFAKRRPYSWYERGEHRERPQSSCAHSLRIGSFKRDLNGDVVRIQWPSFPGHNVT